MSLRSPYFSIQNSNASIYHLDFLHSRAIVLNNKDFSFIILHPDTQLAFDVLEEGTGTFEMHEKFEDSSLKYQGPIHLTLPEKVLKSVFDLALPLQSFGSVSVFQKSQDFSEQFFGCSEVTVFKNSLKKISLLSLRVNKF